MKEEWASVIAAFNLLATELRKGATKTSALNAKSLMKELVLLLNRKKKKKQTEAYQILVLH